MSARLPPAFGLLVPPGPPLRLVALRAVGERGGEEIEAGGRADAQNRTRLPTTHSGLAGGATVTGRHVMFELIRQPSGISLHTVACTDCSISVCRMHAACSVKWACALSGCVVASTVALGHVRVGCTHGGHACPAWGAAQRCAVGAGPRSDVRRGCFSTLKLDTCHRVRSPSYLRSGPKSCPRRAATWR